MAHVDPVGVAIALVFAALMITAFWWMVRQPPPARPPRPATERPGALVPVTDLAATERAVELACRLEGSPDVILLHVNAVPFTLPLDAAMADRDRERRELLALGRVIAIRAGRSTRERSIRDRDLAEAVLRVAREEGARAIVLGVPETRLPYWCDWSRAADRIRRKARCEVIVESAHSQQGVTSDPRRGCVASPLPAVPC